VEDDDDDDDDEKEVDQSAADMERESAKSPQNEKNQSDRQKHDCFSLRDTALVCDRNRVGLRESPCARSKPI
jgi:hypothetical protein